MKKFNFFMLFFLLILINYSCENKNTQDKTEKNINPIQVKVKKITEQTIPNYIKVIGFVKASEVVNISPKINGYLKYIKYNEGDYVKKGEIVAEIENQETVNKLKSLKEKLNALKISLKQLKEMLNIDKKSYLQAKSNFEYAEKTFLRYKKLLKSESITRQEYDKVFNNYTNAKLELEKSKKLLEISELKILQTKKEIKSVSENIKSIQVVANYRFVKSPISGIVTKKFVDTGNFINIGMPIIKIVSKEKQGYFYVPSQFFSNIKIGYNLIINKKLYKITNVSPDINKTSQFLVKVNLNNKSFKNGEYLEGLIEIGKKKAIILENKFIKKYEDFYYTYIVKENSIIKVYLKVKKIDNNKYEVISGLNNGDLLIIEPLNNLKDNFPCKIVN